LFVNDEGRYRVYLDGAEIDSGESTDLTLNRNVLRFFSDPCHNDVGVSVYRLTIWDYALESDSAGFLSVTPTQPQPELSYGFHQSFQAEYAEFGHPPLEFIPFSEVPGPGKIHTLACQ
jgi:hypothetical protein